MSLRRYGSLALALSSLVACRDVSQEAPASQIVIAAFASPDIPTPNDLALQATPTLPGGAQKDLLQSFVDANGFPSDQEVSVAVPFRSIAWDASTMAYQDAAVPPLDLATVTSTTAAVIKVDGTPQVIETEASWSGVSLVLRKKADASGSRRWAPGRYVIAVRGGPNGVRTTAATGALPVAPDQAIALVLENKDLTVKENQPPGGLPTALVTQLETIRSLLWNPITWSRRNIGTDAAPIYLWTPSPSASVTAAFTAVDAAFPHAEVAAIGTFGIAPAALTPLTDSGSGQIPLPSTFLLDGSRPVPGQVDRYFVRNVPAFGPAAAGLATLDGFSTTGMMLAPLSGPALASSIDSSSVLLFQLPTRAEAEQGAVPRRMRDVALALGAGQPGTAEFLLQPPALNRTVTVGGTDVSVTTAVGLQPGVPVPTPTAAGIVYVPPLQQTSNYLVVITDRVKDPAGNALRRSTLANILFTLAHPPVDAQGHSTLVGVSDADAQALYALRTNLDPVLSNIGALSGDPTLTKDDVVMAYTVQTQTVTDVSVGLSALPYSRSPTAFVGAPTGALDLTAFGFPADAMTTLFPAVDSFITAVVPTVNAINPATGALNPDQDAWEATGIPALIAVPKCAVAPCVAPLVVWHHGLNGGHLQMLTVANSLAAKGFVVAAIDAPYHGDRAFCAQDSDCTTDGTADGVCTPDQAMAGQGDAVPPGTCTTGHLREGTNLTTVASGNYFVSGNFFRLRDGIRQHLIDQAALVLTLARPPDPFPQPVADAIAAALLGRGVVVDPTHVYYEGHSQGAVNGTSILATNPRYSRGVLNVPGGTMVDIFTTAPDFTSAVDALFLSLGIDRSLIATDPIVASRYLQTLIIAKWILDPADPINYAAHLEQKLASPLLAPPPNGFGGTPLASDTTEVLGQLSRCDGTVPNATTVVNGVPLAYGDLLLRLGGADAVLYQSASAANGCVSHSVLLDTFAALSGGTSIGGQVRDDAAQFLLDLTVPSSPVTLP